MLQMATKTHFQRNFTTVVDIQLLIFEDFGDFGVFFDNYSHF